MNHSTVIDLTDNPKNAALYFDYVIPIHYSFFEEIADTCIPFPTKDLTSIYPKALTENIEEYMRFWFTFAEFQLSEPKETNAVPDAIPDRDEASKDFISLLEKYAGPEVVFICPEDDSQELYCDKCYECSQIKLSQLPLIDTAKSEWEHIIEIRKDKASINKLRKLKTFFHEKYSGKEKNFIQDDLLTRIEDYSNTAKDWGFETLNSSLMLLNTSTAIGSSLVLALTGQPLEVAVAQGLCVGVGNMALHLTKEKHKMMKLSRGYPLAYIIDVKKKLES